MAWRSCDRYYGWAAMPPAARFEADVGFQFGGHVGADVDFSFGLGEADFAFVPCNAFLEVDLGHVLVPRERVTSIFRQTTIVRNTYITRNTTVINSGISNREVATRTGRSIETVRLTDQRAVAGSTVAGERRSGNEISVFRPKLAATAPLDPPAAIKRRAEVPARRTPYPTVSAQSEQAAQRRLKTEISQRKAATSRSEPAVTRTETDKHAEDAAQQRLDREKETRRTDEAAAEHQKAEPKQESKSESEARATLEREKAARQESHTAAEQRKVEPAKPESPLRSRAGAEGA